MSTGLGQFSIAIRKLSHLRSFTPKACVPVMPNGQQWPDPHDDGPLQQHDPGVHRTVACRAAGCSNTSLLPSCPAALIVVNNKDLAAPMYKDVSNFTCFGAGVAAGKSTAGALWLWPACAKTIVGRHVITASRTTTTFIICTRLKTYSSNFISIFSPNGLQVSVS